MGDRLAGKTAVVTGASGGIGSSIALRFAAEGARVLVHYCQAQERARQTVKSVREAGGDACSLQADLSVVRQLDQFVEECFRLLGRIDVWVNNAGADILTGVGAGLNEQQRLQRLVETDLLGTVRCCWKVAPRMQSAGGGVILNMSWALALQQGMPGRNPEMFAAVKGGVSAFSKCLARSFAPQVRVNDLAPGWIETDFARNVMESEFYRRITAQIPLGRFGLPEEVAAAALFLASQEAAFITGQSLRIDGGATD